MLPFSDLQKEAEKDPAAELQQDVANKTPGSSPITAAGPSLITPAEKDESNNNEDNTPLNKDDNGEFSILSPLPRNHLYHHKFNEIHSLFRNHCVK